MEEWPLTEEEYAMSWLLTDFWDNVHNFMQNKDQKTKDACEKFRKALLELRQFIDPPGKNREERNRRYDKIDSFRIHFP